MGRYQVSAFQWTQMEGFLPGRPGSVGVTAKDSSPLRCALTGGQAADSPQAIPLLSGIEADCVISYEGYESNKIPAFILANGATAVIPPKSNRGAPCEYDRQRILIERTFDKLKRWRRIATR